ncbi:MAG: LytR/AlgR family response regulator transcription factor, partial [Candidatus Cryptobacteroides sp.]
MRVLIVEDEEMARKSLIRSLEKNYPQIQVVGCTGSVSETVDWLKSHGSDEAGMHGGWTEDSGVDIIFMDVELSDGNCFEIFRQTDVKARVIMTTAYDTYAIKAFEAGSIDYLLKPINPADLDRSIRRAMERPNDINAIIRQLGLGDEKKKERLIVKINDRIVPVRIDEIAYFYSE